LVVVTRGAVAVTDTDDPDPDQGAVWGLIRSAQAEHPHRFTLLDTDQPHLPDPTTLTHHTELALRNNTLHTTHLTPHTPTTTTTPTLTGTILITGGTGALGTITTRHLATHHPHLHLVLASRQGTNAPTAPELTTLGADIRTCDITDPHQLQQLINTLPNLTAVIHTAGTLHDTPLHKLTPHNLHHTLQVKAHTAHHLHQLTQNHNLTHFITYSSLTGTIGNPGQTAYAAANAYLDTLTTHRHHHHQPATSIAWGPWHLTTGMTAHLTTTDHHRITTTGTTPLTTTHALQLLDQALTTTTPTLIAANLNPTALHRAR
ncbi:beta-ketoacyl reductase, partial [Micromonospora zhanjiangensis]